MNNDKRILPVLVFCVLVIVPGLLYVFAPGNEGRKEDRPIALSFDVLKKWTYVEGKTPVPDFIRAFDGKSVDMTGYMMALDTVDDIRSFILMPSLFGCCYGQPPAVNHVVLVKMAGKKRAKYFEDAVRVRGRFHCSEEKQDGELLSLYRIDADEVDPSFP
jgi:hypothetical protein